MSTFSPEKALLGKYGVFSLYTYLFYNEIYCLSSFKDFDNLTPCLR